MERQKREIVIVAGPTAVGKTEYAIRLAEELTGEIVSADSMQLYRHMDIGSAKPTASERARVKHYLVDEIEPSEPFSAALYQRKAKAAIEEIFSRGKLPIICGGTGLYVNSLIYDMDFSEQPRIDGRREALEEEARVRGNQSLHEKLKELDPEAAARIHPNNVKKVIRALEVMECGGRGIPEFQQSFVKTQDYGCILIGLRRDREELYDRINRRVDILLETGLIDEIHSLLDRGLTEENISMKGIGYKELIAYFHGEYPLAEAVRLVKRNTRHYAKRQMTWFCRLSDMKWFKLSEKENSRKCLGEMLTHIESRLGEGQTIHGVKPDFGGE